MKKEISQHDIDISREILNMEFFYIEDKIIYRYNNNREKTMNVITNPSDLRTDPKDNTLCSKCNTKLLLEEKKIHTQVGNDCGYCSYSMRPFTIGSSSLKKHYPDGCTCEYKEETELHITCPYCIIPSKVYLAVPYAEKDQVKQLGARFDWDVKKWYIMSNNPNCDILQKRWKLNTDPVVLTGEDRKYGGNDLFVDLIPRSCWFTNVRSCTHPTDWDRLRHHVYSRANNTCECCNNKINIEAHERWDYDIKTKTQKLVRLVALCKMCHTSTHIGFAKIKGNYQEALEHLKQVRSFTHEEALEHERKAYQVWKERNKIEWTLDLSILSNIKLVQKKSKPR